jgi:CheY-like chemotaxis protein
LTDTSCETDNPINQIILSTFLKRKGIKHSVAKNGQEAVDQWKAGDFHLVLMDIQLPVKDGIEATQEIRAVERSNNTQFLLTPSSEASNPISTPSSGVASPYELPVIIVALTASNLQSDRVNALAAGCNDFLTKPVSLQWLEKKLVEWGSMAYLSGFSSKRRVTISSPIDNLKNTKSLGSQALELAAQLEAAKIKDDPNTSK